MKSGVSFWKNGIRLFLQNKIALTGACLLLLIAFFAIFGPLMSSNTYFETRLQLKNTAPCTKFWFGTDELGRDLFIRIWWGARISLFIGITASCIDLLIGVVFGMLAGTASPKVDEAMMRFADVLHSIPRLLVVILLTVLLGPGLFSVLIALSFTGWIKMSRIVRSQARRLVEMDFVKTSKALGAGRAHIFLRHLLPNSVGPILITLTVTIPSAIFSEAFLSFLGLGVEAPIASWGSMASDALPAMQSYPWRLFFPAGFISLTLLGFYLLGEGLRDAFDPEMHS